MKKAIITGASGFLGTWLVKELLSNNVEVIAIVRESSNIESIQSYPNVRIVVLPLSKMADIPSIIHDNDVDVFYHLAWQGTSGRERADYKMQLSNVKSVCDAVKTSSNIGCTKFVYAGSIMEYEVMENMKAGGIRPGLGNIYSTAKLTADFFGKTLATDLNISFLTAIISNVFGAGEKSARFLNTTLRKFLKHETTEFTSGEQPYDFIYVTDAVKALYLIGKDGIGNTSYYIGNKKSYPLKEFIARMRDVIDKEIKLEFGKISHNTKTLDFTEFDKAKLSNEFGFKPKVSFEQGVEMTAQWIVNNECDDSV